MCERELETEQRLQHIDLPSSSGRSSVSFSFSCTAQPGAWGSALCWELVLTARSRTLQALNCAYSIGGPEGPLRWVLFSLQHPISNWSIGVPRAPSAGCCFLYSTKLYYCFTPTQSLPITGQRNMQLPPSLEWHVWSSSSWNNCHAVHRSPSSGASAFDWTVGF